MRMTESRKRVLAMFDEYPFGDEPPYSAGTLLYHCETIGEKFHRTQMYRVLNDLLNAGYLVVERQLEETQNPLPQKVLAYWRVDTYNQQVIDAELVKLESEVSRALDGTSLFGRHIKGDGFKVGESEAVRLKLETLLKTKQPDNEQVGRINALLGRLSANPPLLASLSQ